MNPGSLEVVDRQLDALDPTNAAASRGRSLAVRPGSSSAVDALLDELGGPLPRTSGLELRAPKSADEESETTMIMDVKSFLRGAPSAIAPVAPPTPVVEPPPAADVGVDPELSFDDLFDDDAPVVEVASEPIAAPPSVRPKPPEHASVERATAELDDDELAALDSLEIVLDD